MSATWLGASLGAPAQRLPDAVQFLPDRMEPFAVRNLQVDGNGNPVAPQGFQAVFSNSIISPNDDPRTPIFLAPLAPTLPSPASATVFTRFRPRCE